MVNSLLPFNGDEWTTDTLSQPCALVSSSYKTTSYANAKKSYAI
jgi:hypothetical protein